MLSWNAPGRSSSGTKHATICSLARRPPPPPPAARRLPRQAQEADRPMLVRWVRAFLGEAFGEDRPPTDAEQMVGRRLEGPAEGLYLWDDGGPRALAGFAGPTANGIRVGPVYTPPEHR